jgi:Flp pilus assembly pilin Flp
MAEYTVVISIVTLIVIAAFAALSSGVAAQLTRIAGYVFS